MPINITDQTGQGTAEFGDIDVREAFRHEGCLWVKACEWRFMDDVTNAFCLTDGELGVFEPDDIVVPVDLDVIVFIPGDAG
jgi:hypothetical protein